LTDFEGVDHTVTVTAASVYEAVARGIASLRRQEWVDRLTLEAGTVTVEVGEAPVEHRVKLAEFNRWVARAGARSPREMIQHGRVEEILDGR
jgi:hypothetical protein